MTVNPVEILKPYLKAVVALISPGVPLIVAAVQDGSPGGAHIIGQEWVAIGAACILSCAAVWAVPNLPRTDEPRGPDSVSARDGNQPN